MERPNLRLYLFFSTTYLAQGLVGIAYIPIYFLLKDVMKLSPSESAVFAAAMSAPFLLKPLLGIITDAFPIRLLRRRPYLVASSLFTCAGWAGLACMETYTYVPALVLLTAVNVGICFVDVLCDGVMVEHGKADGKTGQYQAAQIGTLYITLLATGVGGGWLAENISYRGIFGLTAVFPLLILGAAMLIDDPPVPKDRPTARLLGKSLVQLLRSQSFWTTSALILLFNFSPYKGTSWFYYQTGELGFSAMFIGTLTSISGIAGVAGAALFGNFYHKAGTADWVKYSVLAGIPLSLLFLTYRGTVSAIVITALSSLLGVAMRLSLMDLAAKSCPKHGEATAFALYMSVFNISAWLSNMVGADLYERLSPTAAGPRGAMALMILFGTACIAACWPLVNRK